MAKILCYHGTSIENLPSILENGLKVSQSKIWNVSENAVYCWSKNYAVELGIEFDEIEEYEGNFLQNAAESGTCAVVKSRKDCRVCVIKFEVDESELSDDTSCPNMGETNCVYRDIKPEEILQVFVSKDLSAYRLFMMGGLLRNNMYDKDGLDPIEMKFAHKLYQHDFGFFDYTDEIMSLELYSCVS